jgi:D-tyrosyl-tRNA(Tyr) deacylase
MRALLQRVTSASVRVGDEIVGRIEGEGLLVLLGVTHTDGDAEARQLAEKTWTLRILSDERSCSEVAGPLLVVSQFTLYANTRKGRRPSWNAAAPRPISEPLVEAYVEHLRSRGAEVATGVFGATMEVSLVNSGPVTVLLDTAVP